MIYTLMQTDPEHPEQFIGVFTRPESLQGYLNDNPPQDGSAYYLLECQPDMPGVARRIDLALVANVIDSPPMDGIDAPIQMVVPAGLTERPRFDMKITSSDGRELLHLFETGDGILDAIFRPDDLTDAAAKFAREFMKAWKDTYGG